MANLILVDDDHEMAEAFMELLRIEGHDVRLAHNGIEGLALLADDPPDAILCDVEMPLLDGPGMAYQMLLRDAGAEKIPFILVSGVADLPHVARDVGTPYFVGKPFTPEQLLATLHRALTEQIPPTPPPTAYIS